MEKIKQFIHTVSPIKTETWTQVGPLFVETKLAKLDYFVREGQTSKKIAFLEEGVVRAFYQNKEGTEYNKHFFTTPSIIGGFSSLITGKASLINQQALTDCRIWIADYARFCKYYDAFPDLERAGRRMAELFFVEKEKREVEIVMLDAEKRYAIFQEEYPGLAQIIPQYHIASYLGITPTQLSRIRRKLAERG